MSDKPSLKTIAEQTGLSLSQVSRALSGRGRVSGETRGKVHRIVSSIGYRNHSHRHRSHFCVLLPELHLTYRDLLITLFRSEFLKDDGVFILDSARIDFLPKLNCDAVIVIDFPEDLLEKIRSEWRLPLTTISIFDHRKTSDIFVDTAKFCRDCRNRFSDAGCRKTLTVELTQGPERMTGSKKLFIRSENLEKLPEFIRSSGCDSLIVNFCWHPLWWQQCCCDCHIRCCGGLTDEYNLTSARPNLTTISGFLPAKQIAGEVWSYLRDITAGQSVPHIRHSIEIVDS